MVRCPGGRHLLHRETVAHQHQDLVFARRECGLHLRAFAGLSGERTQCHDRRLFQIRIDQPLAGGDALDGRPHIAQIVGLAEVAAHAELECLQDRCTVVAIGEHEDSRRHAGLAQGPERLDAVALIEIVIEHDDLRHPRAARRQEPTPIPDLVDDLDRPDPFTRADDRITDQRVRDRDRHPHISGCVDTCGRAFAMAHGGGGYVGRGHRITRCVRTRGHAAMPAARPRPWSALPAWPGCSSRGSAR